MSSCLTLSPTEEEDAAERIEQVQTDVQQTETSQTTEEREISTTQQHNVPETEGQLMGVEHRVTPPPTAPVAQRLLRARSHLAPFSFPQVSSRSLFTCRGKSCRTILLENVSSGASFLP